MDGLVAFLGARLDEDARLVNAASTDIDASGEWTATRNHAGTPAVTTVYLGREALVASPLATQDAAFIARFDPSQMRREVEFGRWLLAEHAERYRGEELQRYALRYDWHPDYLPEWRPA